MTPPLRDALYSGTEDSHLKLRRYPILLDGDRDGVVCEILR